MWGNVRLCSFPKIVRVIFLDKYHIWPGVASILFSRGLTLCFCSEATWEQTLKPEFCQIFAFSLRPTFPRCQTLYFWTAFEADRILPPNFWLWTTFFYFHLLKVFISRTIHFAKQDLYRFSWTSTDSELTSCFSNIGGSHIATIEQFKRNYYIQMNTSNNIGIYFAFQDMATCYRYLQIIRVASWDITWVLIPFQEELYKITLLYIYWSLQTSLDTVSS